MKKTRKESTITTEPVRRLSPWRVSLAILIVAGLISGCIFAAQNWQVLTNQNGPTAPWFASYVDVTATPTFAFEQLGTTKNRDVILSFVVARNASTCEPTWGTAYTMDQARGALDLDRRIARLRQQGSNIAISFGGQRNDELAVACKDTNELEAAYRAVIQRYQINTIDLDIEGDGLNNSEANNRRATAVAALQKDMRAQGNSLAVWATLPVAPTGLSEAGTDTVSILLSKGVDLAGVNAMTMDYGQSLPAGSTMASASQSALIQTHRQLGILYKKVNIQLSDRALWAKIGATPMIGQNDISNEIFTMNDAKDLNSFAQSQGIGRMSMWSANRDLTCGSNYINLQVVSSSCSGIDQQGKTFAEYLSSGFTGSMTKSAYKVTTTDPKASAKPTPDDPNTSPYQIWSDTGAYLEGTKVVWHHNVYKAKWWTQGDLPDSPVLQSWQTPWELIGPVLPGEKPIPQATLPAGTYAEWSGDASYNTGDRVLFNGVPYQAKWWNKGQSPAASTSNPTSSPWAPFTEAQLEQVQKQLQK
ncbi:MAG TPA: carbohydrate-binding protein [Candidatus Saccharimonadales bacterium]